MSTTTAKGAYTDCYELFDRALASPKGIRISAETRGAAKQIMVRLQYARTILRQESQTIYPKGDPAYGTSPYDSLIVRNPRQLDGTWWVYIEPRAIIGEVQELGIEPVKRRVV